MKKVFHFMTQTIYITVTVAVLLLALFFVGTKVDLFGYEVKVVKSGSMEPAIPTGAIVVIAGETTATYNVGDVITFGEDTGRAIPITHRVVEASGAGRSAVYYTKGDANQERDPEPVRGYEVIGKVVFSVPMLGLSLIHI